MIRSTLKQTSRQSMSLLSILGDWGAGRGAAHCSVIFCASGRRGESAVGCAVESLLGSKVTAGSSLCRCSRRRVGCTCMYTTAQLSPSCTCKLHPGEAGGQCVCVCRRDRTVAVALVLSPVNSCACVERRTCQSEHGRRLAGCLMMIFVSAAWEI